MNGAVSVPWGGSGREIRGVLTVFYRQRISEAVPWISGPEIRATNPWMR